MTTESGKSFRTAGAFIFVIFSAVPAMIARTASKAGEISPAIVDVILDEVERIKCFFEPLGEKLSALLSH